MTTLIVLAILGVIGYRLSLALWPYTPCKLCGGGGRNAGSNRNRFGTCHKCGGSGRRERLGVRLFVRRR